MKKITFKNTNLLRLFGTIIICVLFVEFGLMYFLEIILDDASHFVESLVDSVLLSIIISPVLYFFVFRYLIKEMKNREESEKKYKDLFESSDDAIMTLYPPNWNFSDGNPATLKIFGLKSIEELKQITPGDVSPQYQPDGGFSSEKAKEMIGIALKNGKNSFDWVHKKLKGEDFYAEVSLTKIEAGNQVYLQTVVRDVTEAKNAIENERKLAEENKNALLATERANKLMVGRELEMIKLKKELTELKSKNSNEN